MPEEDVIDAQQIVSECVHVERANKVKNFHIFDRTIPLSLVGSKGGTTPEITICSCHNFSPLSFVQIPLISTCCLLCVLM